MLYLVPVMIIIAVVEIRKIIREGYYKTLYLFVAIWLFAFVYSGLVIYEALANPTDIMFDIIPLILELILNMFNL